MSELRLAGNFIDNFFAFGSGHLQIVMVNDDGTQLENEVQVPDIRLPFVGNWKYEDIRDHTDLMNTPHYTTDINDKSKYAYTTLDLGDRSAESVWDILLQVRDDFITHGSDINYFPTQNSNSYANTLLSVVGIDTKNILTGATPTDINGFPGVGKNVLKDLRDAVPLDLEGSPENDIIHTGIRKDTVHGNAGNDKVYGGKGGDSLYGGIDQDDLYGQKGKDFLYGESGNDDLYGGKGRDYLYGGSGLDILNGGRGKDHLYGGSDNDIFVFRGKFGNDTVYDFELDGDLLDVVGTTETERQTALNSATVNEQGLQISFENGTITLVGLGIEDAGPNLFDPIFFPVPL